MWPLFDGGSGLSIPGPGGVGEGEPEFDPSDISGLVAHFEVSSGITVDTNAPADSVSQWASTVGSAVLSQGTKTRQPIIVPGTFGSYPALDYDSSLISDLSMNSAGCALTNNVAGFTALLVCQPDGISTDSLLEFSIAASNSVRWGLSLKSTGGENQLQLNARRQDSDSLATLTGTTAVPTTGFSVVAATVDYTTGAAALYVNGTLAGSDGALVSTGSGTDSTDSNGVKLGRATAGGAVFDGLVGNVLIYQAALSSSDISDLTTWLETQLGLS